MDYKTVKTTRGELKYFRDWENRDGGIIMINPQTVGRYMEILKEEPDMDECGVFFAFNDESFDKGYRRLVERGHIKDGDRIVRKAVCGLYGTECGLKRFNDFYKDKGRRIASECDPQEVYFREYNNHESMIGYEGDTEPVSLVIRLWGEETARKIKRFSVVKTVDELLKTIKI